MLGCSSIKLGVSDLLDQIPGLDILSLGLCSADSPISVREEVEEKTAEYLCPTPLPPHPRRF